MPCCACTTSRSSRCRPLQWPETRPLPAVDALTQYEAVAFFIQRARAVQPDFQLTSENALAVAEICRTA